MFFVSGGKPYTQQDISVFVDLVFSVEFFDNHPNTLHVVYTHLGIIFEIYPRLGKPPEHRLL